VAPRFSRARLIDTSDTQYRAFVRQIMIGKDNERATRLPLPRELFGGEAEAALREWLAQRFTLSDRRIVEYLEHRGRSAIKKYRELDAVVLSEQKTIEVFEIKASQKATSLRRAAQQLADTRAILGMLFRRVNTTILLVDTGIPTAEDVADLMAAEDAPICRRRRWTRCWRCCRVCTWRHRSTRATPTPRSSTCCASASRISSRWPAPRTCT
jgi:hypothetical protein